MGNLECKIIRSARKSFGLEVNAEGLIVRAPLQATDRQIQELKMRVHLNLKS